MLMLKRIGYVIGLLALSAFVMAWANRANAAGCDNYIFMCQTYEVKAKPKVKRAGIPEPIRQQAIQRSEAAKERVAVRKATGCRAVVIRGLMGEVLSPMSGLAAQLRARGCSVSLQSHFAANTQGATHVIGHSMGIFPALRSCAPHIYTVDIPFWAGTQHPNCPNSRIVNYPTAGHPSVAGATNIPIGGNHLSAPNVAQGSILARL